MNPVLSAAFFIGIIEWSRFRKSPKVRFLGLALVLFLLPGLLSGGQEMFRIVALIPILLAGAAAGLSALCRSLKPSVRMISLAALLAVSLGLDCRHLFNVYPGVWIYTKNNWFNTKTVEQMRAYLFLKTECVKKGQGFLVSELVPEIYEQSLSVAAYSFNATHNRDIDASQAKWAVILFNIHYQPYLKEIFPESKWFWLSSDLQRPDGGTMLGLLAYPSSRSDVLNRWIEANRAMHGIVDDVFDNRTWKSRKAVIKTLYKLYPLMKGDRFLESCFWEKIAVNENGSGDSSAQEKALWNAIHLGIPAAHLYNNLGALYLRTGRYREARQAFLECTRFPLNRTSDAMGLEVLDQLEKNAKPPEGRP